MRGPRVAAGRGDVRSGTAAPPLHTQAIASVRGVGLRALRMLPSAPPATLRALRAACLLLGRPAAAVATWREASGQLGLKLLEDLAAYDARCPVDSQLCARYDETRNALCPPVPPWRRPPPGGFNDCSCGAQSLRAPGGTAAGQQFTPPRSWFAPAA